MVGLWSLRSEGPLADRHPVRHEDLQLIGDGVFVVGVPWHFNDRFKRYVFAAAKAWCMRIKSVDYTLKRYGDSWPSFHLAPSLDVIFNATAVAKRMVISALEYAKSIDNKPGHHGVVAAGAALLRLQQTFASATMMIRHGLQFEASALQRVILEQLAWAYAIRDLREGVFEVHPQRCITKLKELYPGAGRLYGVLAEVSHIHPETTKMYIRPVGQDLAIHLAQPDWVAFNARFLLILADLYGVVMESLYLSVLGELRYLSRQPDSRFIPSSHRPFVADCQRWTKDLLELPGPESAS